MTDATSTPDNVTGKDPDKTILVAQRNVVDANFVASLLEHGAGFRVIIAESANDMIHKLQSGPDLILLDTNLGRDCFKAVELMRRMPKLNHVGIVALSADQTHIKRCMRKGFNGFIQKPFTPEGFTARVWKMLDGAPPRPLDGGPARLDIKIDEIDDLPTLPAVYAQVEQLCQNPNVSTEDISRVIQADPSTTMKLLKLSNSAFFGFNREIRSVRDAVSLLGNEAVKNAVLSISILEATRGLDGSAGLDRTEFWKHSAACGSIVRFMTHKMRIQRDDAFTSGILHDIGKVLLDGLYGDFYADVLERVVSGRLFLLEAEERVVGLNHARLGHELAGSWGIPPRLTEAITYHHNPARAELDPELASLVHVADAVARNLGIGSGGDPYVPVIHSFAFTQLALEPGDLIKWEADMTRDIEKDMVFLSTIG